MSRREDPSSSSKSSGVGRRSTLRYAFYDSTMSAAGILDILPVQVSVRVAFHIIWGRALIQLVSFQNSRMTGGQPAAGRAAEQHIILVPSLLRWCFRAFQDAFRRCIASYSYPQGISHADSAKSIIIFILHSCSPPTPQSRSRPAY